MSEAFRLSSKHIWILDELLDGDIALLHFVQRCQAMGLEAWEGLALLPELYCEGLIEFFERNQVHGAEGIAWKPERDFAEVLAGLSATEPVHWRKVEVMVRLLWKPDHPFRARGCASR